MKRILDRSFKYVPAASTDIRETFARIRKELEEQKRREEEIQAEARSKTISLRKAR